MTIFVDFLRSISYRSLLHSSNVGTENISVKEKRKNNKNFHIHMNDLHIWAIWYRRKEKNRAKKDENKSQAIQLEYTAHKQRARYDREPRKIREYFIRIFFLMFLWNAESYKHNITI